MFVRSVSQKPLKITLNPLLPALAAAHICLFSLAGHAACQPPANQPPANQPLAERVPESKSPANQPSEPPRMLLWPDLDAPANQAPANQAPGAAGNASGDRPTLQFYRADSTTPTAAVLVVPGGGYGGLADGHEGTEIARWLNSAGISAAICRYRHRNSGAGYGYPHPLLDAQRGVRMLRAEAESWNIDPNRIGVIGFSAGGHLVTSLSTTETLLPNAQDPLDSYSSRPDFAIVCYPVIAFGRPYTHQGSQRNLLGSDVPAARLEELSTDRRVTAETPPTFLWHTAEDPVVSVQNALVYYQALVAAGVPAELHIFERGRHGLGLARAAAGGPKLPSSHWPQLCLSWLEQHGFLK